jgi:hypothetical protein
VCRSAARLARGCHGWHQMMTCSIVRAITWAAPYTTANRRSMPLEKSPLTPTSRAKPAGSKKLGMLFMGCSCIGLLFLSKHAIETIAADLSKDWPRVEALRIQAKVVEGEGKNHGKYFLEAVYRYEVGNGSFLGDRVAFGERWSGSAANLNQMAAEMNEKAFVSYWPRDPSVSVLIPGRTTPGFTSLWPSFVISSSVFFLFGVAAFRHRAPDIRNDGHASKAAKSDRQNGAA